MQRTRILLSIGDKNMENYFLLFMDNKIARGRPSIIIDGWKEILSNCQSEDERFSLSRYCFLATYICYLKFLTFMTKV